MIRSVLKDFFYGQNKKLIERAFNPKFFLAENETERPSSKYSIVKSIAINNHYSMKNIKKFIKEFNEKNLLSDGK